MKQLQKILQGKVKVIKNFYKKLNFLFHYFITAGKDPALIILI